MQRDVSQSSLAGDDSGAGKLCVIIAAVFVGNRETSEQSAVLERRLQCLRSVSGLLAISSVLLF